MNNNDLNKKIIITDCLSNDLREKLLVDCKPFLRKLGNDYPAYQSDNNISNYPQFQLVHQIFHSLSCKYLEEELLLEGSWFIMTEGKEEQSIMHDHPADYVGVYYMNSHPSFPNGTEFEEEGLVEAPENSMVLFPGHLVHSPPRFKCNEYFERYTMSLDWNVRNLRKREYLQI